MAMPGLITVLLMVAFLLPYALAQTSQGENTSIAILELPTPPTLQCERIRNMPICVEMPWNYTLFPNLLGHESQEEANLQLEQFRQLIELKCSNAIVHFLCSIYAPLCIDDHAPRVLHPCRRLCQHVREGCELPFLERASGLLWPDHFDCEKYDNSPLCFGPSEEELLKIPAILLCTR